MKYQFGSFSGWRHLAGSHRIISCGFLSWFVASYVLAGTQYLEPAHPKTAAPLCRRVAEALDNDRRPNSHTTLYVDSIDLGGHSWRYQGIDLDRDSKSDDVMQSCGSPSDGGCMLIVTLSQGGGYKFSEEIFKVVHFESNHYVVVGDSYPPARDGLRRLYKLTEHGAELICKSF